MLRMLHVTSRVGFGMVKGVIGLEAEDPYDIMGHVGGAYSKIAQAGAASRTPDTASVFDEHEPYNPAELDRRFRAFCSQHGLDGDAPLLHSGSIGGVYRVQLASGETVAVKVRYPGIDDLFQSDARLLRMSSLVQSSTRAALTHQVADALLIELDYEAEQRTIQQFHERWHPTVRVPALYSGLCCADVTVMSYLESTPLLEYVRSATVTERASVATQLTTFLLLSWARDGLVYADPHWGNLSVDAGGTLSVVDFGCVATVEPQSFQRMFTSILATHAGDRHRDPDESFYRVFGEIFLGPLHTADSGILGRVETTVFGSKVSGDAPDSGSSFFKMLYLYVCLLHEMSVQVDFRSVSITVINTFNTAHPDHAIRLGPSCLSESSYCRV